MEYRILHLEDSSTDADLVKRLLKKSGMSFLYLLVSDKNGYQAGLTEFNPDVILCDHTLPGFDSKMAYAIYREKKLDIPFILVTGNVSEEFAVEMLQKGVHDYLLKTNLTRLPQAIENACFKRENEQRLRDMQLVLEQSESHLRTIFETSVLGLILLNAEGKILEFNNISNCYCHIAWGGVLIKGKNLFNIISEFRKKDLQGKFKQVLKEVKVNYESIHLHYDGTATTFNIILSPVLDSRNVVTGVCLSMEDITLRKEEEEDRIKTGEIFRLMAENMSDMVARHSPEGTYLYVSPSSEKILGYKQEELIGVDPYSIMHPEDLEHVRKGIHQKALSGDVKQVQEYRLKHKNGEYIWVESSASAIFGEVSNEAISIQSITRDITERKKTETKLKQLSQAVEQSPASVVITDTMGNIEYVNQKFIELTGYNAAEAIGKNPRILKSGFTSALEYKKLWKQICSGAEWKGELLNKKKNGELYWESALISPVFNPKGTITHFLAIKEDISKRKEQEIRLREALDRYCILAQATSDTIWDWDITSNLIVYNDGVTKMFGYPENQIENTMDWWKEKLHPDDVKKVAGLFREVFEKKAERLQLTYRFRCNDGFYKYIFDRACVLFDDSGKPTRMIGAMQDITYQVEEEMRMTKAILDAQEKERRFIGTELHDNVNQILAGAILTFSMINKKSDNSINELVASGTMHLTNAINEIRKLSHKLVPATFSTLSLKDTVENLLMIINLSDQFSIDLQFDEIEKENISNDIKINLYRILQEQLNNIIKHADATAIEIAVTLQPGKSIKMRIRDNGKGFETINGKSGIGLNNMRKRVELLSGKLTINSAIGKGCEIIVDIPF